MQDPLDRAASQPPPTLGEGCVRRYDPDALSPQSGTEFADAAELWRKLQEQAGEQPQPAHRDIKKGAE
ncbi:hypothetical protein PH586_12180 [Pseudomonas sp. SA3-5]|uniref:Uncharacterized protein n=1 Tax=Pseudomonas aestuarii TaxID=3018340 RepID=A0ABT4XG17_9PSED|nr:hypothetical protein [Pseudomonas aestuarii]MDA7087142.1 hypothetical protein [Pseudomonas aestuarii]